MLKKVLIALAAVAGFHAGAQVNLPILDAKALSVQVLSEVNVAKLPWRINDSADYVLDLGGFLKGSMHMFVREETPEGFWIQQDIDMTIQKSKVETLIDANTGQVKKILVDGKEQQAGNPGDTEIVESKPASITVPAGTFECAYLKVHDKKQNTNTDVWVNPEIIPVVGMIKTVAESQMGKIVVELKSFHKQ